MLNTADPKDEPTVRTFVELLPVAAFSLAGGRIGVWNAAAERLLGWSPQEMEGMAVDRISFDAGPAIAKALPVADAETNWIHKDGHLVSIALSAARMGGVAREAPLLCVVSDLTRRARLAESYPEARKMEALGRLAGRIAHDFNNLLTVVSGYSRLASDQVLSGRSEHVHPYLQEIVAAAERGGLLTRQLLAFSRAQPVRPEFFDCRVLLSRLANTMRRLIGEDIELVLDLDTEFCPVKADPERVEQAVTNLVINAGDAMPQGGTLTIGCRRTQRVNEEGQEGWAVAIRVSDTGVGMDSNALGRVFEPFFTTKAPGVGAGLGLATTYGIVKQLGGEMMVQSRLGRGSTFHIFFPLTPEPE